MILAVAICLASGLLATDGLTSGPGVAWVIAAALIAGARWCPWISLIAGGLVLYLRYTGWVDSHFPAVDWIRSRGMDVWPGLLQTAGLVLIIGCGRAAIQIGSSIPVRLLAMVGGALAIGWWGFPQHFNMDRIGPPASGAVPAGAMPMVIDGRIEHREWQREVLPARPVDAWSDIVDNEERLSRIAHGMQQTLNDKGGRVRATLWGLQRPIARMAHWLLALASMGGLVVGIAAAVRSRTGARLAWWMTSLVTLTLVLPPVVNLGLRTLGLLAGLAEAGHRLGPSTALSAATLLVVGLAVNADRKLRGER